MILVVSATLTSFNYFVGVHDYLPSNYGTFLCSQGFTLNNTVTPAGDSIFDIYHDRYEDIRLAGEWDVNFPWAFGGKAVSALVYTHSLGGIAGDEFVPLSQLGASPEFNKIAGETHISQPPPDNFVFAGLARAQTGFGKPLMSAEQLQLAGPDVLSGFALGTVYVDRGGVARGELQRPTALPFQGGAGSPRPTSLAPTAVAA